MSTKVKKNAQGHGYLYTDLAQINDYLDSKGIGYYQITDRIDGNDYIFTVPIIDGKELPARRGVQVVDAVLHGIKNPAQEAGSAITYARRYSLLMAFGLATEDDDGASLTKDTKGANKGGYGKPSPTIETLDDAKNFTLTFGKHNGKTLGELSKTDDGKSYLQWLYKSEKTDANIKKGLKLISDASRKEVVDAIPDEVINADITTDNGESEFVWKPGEEKEDHNGKTI